MRKLRLSAVVSLFLALTVGIGSVLASRGTVLVVVSNLSVLPGTDHAAGVWGEELVLPHALFRGAGYDVVFASPTGGGFVFDPASTSESAVADRSVRAAVNRFERTHAGAMAKTVAMDDVAVGDFAGMFVAGGHGVMFDVAGCPAMGRLAREFLAAGKVVAAVCHGPCFLVNARDAAGRPLIGGYRVTGFSNAEEVQSGMAGLMPFSLQDGLSRASGGLYGCGAPWRANVVVDRNLVTGQNPASSVAMAKAALALLTGGSAR